MATNNSSDYSPTQYGVQVGGSNGTLNSLSLGTLGQVLTSNGPGSASSFQNSIIGISTVNIQVFTTSGTYTPTVGMVYCIIEAVGGGGAGGGSVANASKYSSGGSGGAGEYRRGVFSAADIGSSVSITIGSGGTGNSGSSGGNGGTTVFGSLITSNGGSGGLSSGSLSSSAFSQGGLGGTGGSGGSLVVNGNPGDPGMTVGGGSLNGGTGGNSYFGGAALAPIDNNPIGAVSGNSATGYGSGGSGSAGAVNASAQTGGNGSDGIVVVTEYI